MKVSGKVNENLKKKRTDAEELRSPFESIAWLLIHIPTLLPEVWEEMIQLSGDVRNTLTPSRLYGTPRAFIASTKGGCRLVIHFGSARCRGPDVPWAVGLKSTCSSAISAGVGANVSDYRPR